MGLSDGLTVPFALSAGLSALGDAKVVVLGGLAELVAGAISMGLGGFVGAKSESYVIKKREKKTENDGQHPLLTKRVIRESYETTVREANNLIKTNPDETKAIVWQKFSDLGLSESTILEISASLHASHDKLKDFLLTFHQEDSEPADHQAWISAVTLAIGYFVGGFIPLIPYFIASRVIVALWWSIGVMAITLFVFGYVKACVVKGWKGKANILAGVKGGVQMCVVGGLAAGAAAALVRLISR